MQSCHDLSCLVSEAPPSCLNIDPHLHTPAVLAGHLWLLCLNLQHDRHLTVKSNENEIKAEVLCASARQTINFSTSGLWNGSKKGDKHRLPLCTVNTKQRHRRKLEKDMQQNGRSVFWVQQVVWIQDPGTDRRDTQECYSIKRTL